MLACKGHVLPSMVLCMEQKNDHNRIRISLIYYIPVVILYFLNMFIPAVRPGVLATVILMAVCVELIVRKQFRFGDFEDRLMAAYFLYNALSVIWLVRGGFPVSVFVQEFVVSLLPVVFYYVGRSAVHDREDANAGIKCDTDIRNEINVYYRYFIYAVLFVGITGILLQIVMPQFYIDYSYRLSFVSKADAATCRVRMNSFVGSTVLGFVSVAAMLASIPFIMCKGKKQRIFGIVSMLINLTVAFMSNQRSAMVVAILVVLYFNYLIFFVYRTLDRKYFVFELGAVVIAFIALCVVDMDAVMKIYYRLVSLPDAVGERSEQWIAAVNNMYSTWLGNGLGANGHRALGIEDAHVIADGGLVKMYCEQGVFGFSMFIYILILTFRKGIGNVKEYCVELGIIFVALLQSVGSNILAFQLATPVFWYAVGRVHSSDGE